MDQPSINMLAHKVARKGFLQARLTRELPVPHTSLNRRISHVFIGLLGAVYSISPPAQGKKPGTEYPTSKKINRDNL